MREAAVGKEVKVRALQCSRGCATSTTPCPHWAAAAKTCDRCGGSEIAVLDGKFVFCWSCVRTGVAGEPEPQRR